MSAMFTYEATHASVADQSPAMKVGDLGNLIVLANEDGMVWADPADQWTPLHDDEFLIVQELDEQEYYSERAYAFDHGGPPPIFADHLTWHLMCPHCGALDTIVEVDTAMRWNTLDVEDADFSGGQMFVVASTGDGDFEGDGFLCEDCLSRLDAPDYFEISDWT